LTLAFVGESAFEIQLIALQARLTGGMCFGMGMPPQNQIHGCPHHWPVWP
jgi:hypothetical protein